MIKYIKNTKALFFQCISYTDYVLINIFNVRKKSTFKHIKYVYTETVVISVFSDSAVNLLVCWCSVFIIPTRG